jgi:hypothetical protein
MDGNNARCGTCTPWSVVVLPWSLFLLLFLLTREVHAVSVLFSCFQVFLIPRVYPAYPPSAKRRHSRLGWLWVCLSDEKDEDDAEMVMVMVTGDEEVSQRKST